MQKRHGGDGVSIVVGGDAGTAEGDFATCMIWSTRPNYEVPVVMLVTNNGYGISTTASRSTANAESSIAAARFHSYEGGRNDPIARWRGLDRAFSSRRQTAGRTCSRPCFATIRSFLPSGSGSAAKSIASQLAPPQSRPASAAVCRKSGRRQRRRRRR